MSATPAVDACNAVAAIIDAEFAAEGWTTTHDRLLRATGKDLPNTGAAIGIYPEREQARMDRVIQLSVFVVVQFHLGFDDEPDETIQRDPREIAGYAGRFRTAVGTNLGAAADNWFLRLGEIVYPPDPTGNITRFEALVEAVGENRGSPST